MNDTTEVKNLIDRYRSTQDVVLKKTLLEKILNQLRPMLLARCSHYFGYVTEDLIQMGYARMIELLDLYDDSRTEVPILGYLNRMIACYYFSLNRKMRREKERLLSFEQETLDAVLIAEDSPVSSEYNWDEIFEILNEKEYLIVQEHILNKKTLKVLCQKMEISYPYAKKIKASALKKLRGYLESLASV